MPPLPVPRPPVGKIAVEDADGVKVLQPVGKAHRALQARPPRERPPAEPLWTTSAPPGSSLRRTQGLLLWLAGKWLWEPTQKKA